MMARGGRHVGNAFITLPSEIREKLWRRVEQHAGSDPRPGPSDGNLRLGSMSKIARDPLYRRHRFPAEVIAQAVWLYFRFPRAP